MPRGVTGTYTLPSPPFVPGTKISSTAVNLNFSDIAVALTQSVAVDGTSQVTGPVGFAAGSAALPGIAFQAQLSTGFSWLGTNQVGLSLGGVTDFSFTPPSAANGSGLLGFGGVVIRPIGEITVCAGGVPDVGWALCNGQPILRASYPELFAKISTLYGAGDGSTTFNLPDTRGRVLASIDAGTGRLYGYGLAVALGGSTYQLLVQDLPSHNHSVAVSTDSHTHVVSGTASSHTHPIAASSDPNHFHTISPFASRISHSHSITNVGVSITDVNHSHGITEPASGQGHNHTMTNGVHSHGVTDLNHTHQYFQPGTTYSASAGGTGVSLSGSNQQTAGVTFTSGQTEIVAVNNSADNSGWAQPMLSALHATGITINSSGTGITTGAANGTTSTFTPTATNTDSAATGINFTSATDATQPSISGSAQANSTGITFPGGTGNTGGNTPHNNVQATLVVQHMIFLGRP